jgi:hypothetical protein
VTGGKETEEQLKAKLLGQMEALLSDVLTEKRAADRAASEAAEVRRSPHPGGDSAPSLLSSQSKSCHEQERYSLTETVLSVNSRPKTRCSNNSTLGPALCLPEPTFIHTTDMRRRVTFTRRRRRTPRRALAAGVVAHPSVVCRHR